MSALVIATRYVDKGQFKGKVVFVGTLPPKINPHASLQHFLAFRKTNRFPRQTFQMRAQVQIETLDVPGVGLERTLLMTASDANANRQISKSPDQQMNRRSNE